MVLPSIFCTTPASVGSTTSQTTSTPFFGWGPTSINSEQRGSRIFSYTPTVEGDSVGCSAGELQSLSAMTAYSNKSHEELRSEDYQLGNKGTNPKNCPTSLFTPVSLQNGSSCSEQGHSKLSQASQNNGSPFALPGFQVPYQPGSNAPLPFGISTSASENPFHHSGTSSSISQAESGGSRDCNCKCNQPNAFGQTNSADNPLVYFIPFVNYNTQPVVVLGFPAFATSIYPAAAANESVQHFGHFMPTIASNKPLLGTQISPTAVPFGPVTNFIGSNGLNGAHSTPSAQVASPVIGSTGGSCASFFPFGLNAAHSTAPASVASPVIKSSGDPSTRCFSLGHNKVHSNAPVSIASPAVGSFGCPGFTLSGADGPNGSHSTVPISAASPERGPLSRPVFGFSSHPWGSLKVGASTVWSFGKLHYPGVPSAAPSISSGALAANQTTASEPYVFGTCSNELKVKESDATSSVPKGLELMVEKLGFNPWSLGKDTANLNDSVGGGEILPCGEADKDEDIIALAEFAVEQHNASCKDEKVELENVVAACLEAVGGGRYHIVLDTVRSTDCCLLPKRYYAVVSRKGTERRNHLTVLEKWLPSKIDLF